MAKRKKQIEKDSRFFLKITLFFILGTLWVRLVDVSVGSLEHISLPLGMAIGLLFASHEHFQIDRKIEFAILAVATFISFYLPVGITL